MNGSIGEWFEPSVTGSIGEWNRTQARDKTRANYQRVMSTRPPAFPLNVTSNTSFPALKLGTFVAGEPSYRTENHCNSSPRKIPINMANKSLLLGDVRTVPQWNTGEAVYQDSESESEGIYIELPYLV